MIHRIENKKVQVVLNNENIELPLELKTKINENFEYMKSQGANIWNGEVLCVSACNINDNDVKIICKKSDYAHYLYGERIGCPREYECKNLSAGCLLETIDGYYIVGELDENTSYPTMLQVTGGGIDKNDIFDGIINVESTIIREAMEELNVDLNNEKEILHNKLNYIYISNEGEQPGVQLFSKSKMQMNAKEMDNHFNKYYNYLKQNSLEIEFKKLRFLKKENAIEELMRLNNPKRNYLVPLIQMDLKGI